MREVSLTGFVRRPKKIERIAGDISSTIEPDPPKFCLLLLLLMM